MNFSLTICAFEIRVVGCFGLHSFKNKSFEGISDSEMDYFSVPRRSCESFPTHYSATNITFPLPFSHLLFRWMTLKQVSPFESFRDRFKPHLDNTRWKTIRQQKTLFTLKKIPIAKVLMLERSILYHSMEICK